MSLSGSSVDIRQRLILILIFTTRFACPVYLPKDSNAAADERSKIIAGGGGRGGGGGEGGHTRGRSGEGGGRAGKVFFRDDSDVSWYLKIFNRKIMIWRCKNAIQTTVLDGQPLPFLDLSCSVIGKFWSLSWQHGNNEIASQTGKFIDVDRSGRYSLTVSPHSDVNGHVFSIWNDIFLRIYNVTSQDSGVYLFVVSRWDGPSDRQKIYVDIDEQRSKRNHA